MNEVQCFLASRLALSSIGMAELILSDIFLFITSNSPPEWAPDLQLRVTPERIMDHRHRPSRSKPRSGNTRADAHCPKRPFPKAFCQAAAGVSGSARSRPGDSAEAAYRTAAGVSQQSALPRRTQQTRFAIQGVRKFGLRQDGTNGTR
jgi:hypothetical protein